MAPLVIHRPLRHLSYISLYVPFLWNLSVSTSELNRVTFESVKSWEDFIEGRLQPTVYLLQSAIIHGFTLDGSREIPSEFNDWGMPAIPAACLPGESVALFETLYRIGLSLGFPRSNHQQCHLSRDILLPLVLCAREAQILRKSRLDYAAYDRYGQLLDPGSSRLSPSTDADRVVKDDGGADPAVKIEWVITVDMACVPLTDYF
ncbi:hypothetical protein B0H19DRAFT_1080322 [Mycena capillaripes]|nr:hypothetical protein B0H19DRAFT_1080322 [Mycena capillaripes]